MSAANGQSQYARRCVRLLAEDASYFFKVVSDANQARHDSVLRAAFVVDLMTNEPLLRRAQAVSIRSLDPTFAEALEQLLNTCDKKHQFVAWFTVEGENGVLLDHGTVILDSNADEPVWEGVVHQPPTRDEWPQQRGVEGAGEVSDASSRPGAGGAVRNAGIRTSVEGMRKELVSMNRLMGGRRGSRHDSRHSISSQSEDRPRRGSPRTVRLTGGQATAEPDSSPRPLLHRQSSRLASEGDAGGGNPFVSNGNYEDRVIDGAEGELPKFASAQAVEELLNVVLLISRATAKIAVCVDDTRHRLDKLYDVTAAAAAVTKPPTEVNETILYKMEALEKQLVGCHRDVKRLQSEGLSVSATAMSPRSSERASELITRSTATQVVSLATTHHATQTEWFDVPHPYLDDHLLLINPKAPSSAGRKSSRSVQTEGLAPSESVLSSSRPSEAGPLPRVVAAIPILESERETEPVSEPQAPAIDEAAWTRKEPTVTATSPTAALQQLTSSASSEPGTVGHYRSVEVARREAAGRSSTAASPAGNDASAKSPAPAVHRRQQWGQTVASPDAEGQAATPLRRSLPAPVATSGVPTDVSDPRARTAVAEYYEGEYSEPVVRVVVDPPSSGSFTATVGSYRDHSAWAEAANQFEYDREPASLSSSHASIMQSTSQFRPWGVRKTGAGQTARPTTPPGPVSTETHQLPSQQSPRQSSRATFSSGSRADLHNLPRSTSSPRSREQSGPPRLR